MFTLRPYQRAAKDAVYRHLRARHDNPCVEIPTAGGKTPIMASICIDTVQQWDGRALILTHRRELLEQHAEHLFAAAPELRAQVGIFSAGLNSRDTKNPVILAGIQSAFRRAGAFGPFDLVIVDEAHMIPPDGDGMYRTFLSIARLKNPDVRVIGFTATPYRLDGGPLCGPGNVLNHICYRVTVPDLIAQGYLCPLRSKAGVVRANTSRLRVRTGDFDAHETEVLMNTDELVAAACAEVVEQTADRGSVLVFAAGIDHADHIAEELRAQHGVGVETVFGQTPPGERDRALAAFRARELKYLVNVDVLTTGFDAPNIDCVVLLRPTMSPGLYYQMVGRGFRLCEGKRDCLVLDFGGNVLRHGPVDAVEALRPRSAQEREAAPPARECPDCRTLTYAGCKRCPECGYVFPANEGTRHDATASTAGILSGDVSVVPHPVQSVTYSVHTKRDAPPDAPKTMRVTYHLNLVEQQCEWICFEHDGHARYRAELWWRRRSDDPVPDTAEEAVRLAHGGALLEPAVIAVKSVAGEKYDSVVGYVFADDAQPDGDMRVMTDGQRDAEPQASADEEVPA